MSTVSISTEEGDQPSTSSSSSFSSSVRSTGWADLLLVLVIPAPGVVKWQRERREKMNGQKVNTRMQIK